MQRSLLVVLVVLLVGIAAATWWLLGAPDVAPTPLPTATGTENAEAAAGTQVGSAPVATDAGMQRQAAPAGQRPGFDDPEIRASLCGFKGRVVDHLKQPVADTGLRLFRGAMDSVLPEGMDLFADASAYVPEYVAGDARTDSEGRWQLTGVWPRGLYVLHAGIGTDAPTYQVVTQTPGPGEVVDLGDIVLPNAGVITGTVLDDNGDPLAGALVRCADLPGAIAAFFPIERFDPNGALLVREKSSPVRVVEMPAWVAKAVEELPFPRALTDSDGNFRLVGVVPGSNMLATTAVEFLSDVKASVIVRPGQVKNVGKIRLRRGEDLIGAVVDTADKPVPAAEVLAGSTLSMGPVDLAQRVIRADALGRFTGRGFSPGRVTVAARRGPGHPWVMAEPQSINGEVKVVLPASFGVDVSVLLADGKPAKSPRFQLLTGKAGQGAAEMYLMGVSPPLDLKHRKKPLAEGRWRIDNLQPGAYTLLADAPGHANAFASFEIVDADTAIEVKLPMPSVFTVQVFDQEDKPVRNAAIYAQARGKSLTEMPIRCGRTGTDGQLVVDQLRAETLRVSAEHPKYGTVHGEVKVGETVRMTMLAPGSMHVVVRENGKPPEPGKWSVGIMRRRSSNEPRGPLENMPALHTADLAGEISLKNLQPGEYEVNVVKALDALRSPGGIMALAQEMFLARDLPSTRTGVESGQVCEVQLEVGEQPLEGPTASLSGTVTVDGKIAAGYALTANGFVGTGEKRDFRRFSTRVDERGRFAFATVPAGELQLSLLSNGEGAMFSGPGANLWGTKITLTENEARELTIDVQTTSIRGTCYLPDGTPAVGVFVQGRGRPKIGEAADDMRVGSPTDARGEFHFPQVAEGIWTLSARGGGETSGRGELANVDVVAGVPVTGLRIELQKMLTVTGRVELAELKLGKIRWSYLSWNLLGANDAPEAQGRQTAGSGIDGEKGTFRTNNLPAGRYRVVLFVNADGEQDREQGEYPCGIVEVPATGLTDLVLRPGPRVKR
jgi:hypothetical protein